MTNGERIRLMNDEEMAELMTDEPCPPLHRRKRCPEERNCLKCWAEWLKMDAEETGNMKEMEKTEFTLGPWFYVGDAFTVTTQNGDKDICDLVSHQEASDGDAVFLPYRANARLIAAAPEMYGLLDMIQTFLEVSGDENTRIAFLTQIRKVLAKARGGGADEIAILAEVRELNKNIVPGETPTVPYPGDRE